MASAGGTEAVANGLGADNNLSLGFIGGSAMPTAALSQMSNGYCSDTAMHSIYT